MRLVVLTVGWVIGITLAGLFSQIEFLAWGIGLALSVIIAGIIYRYPQRRWFAFALVALMLGGMRQALVPKTSDIAQYNGNNGTIEGIVVDEPDIRDDRIQLRVQADSIFTNNETLAISGEVLVEAFVLTEVHYGDRIRATGALITPAEWDTFSYADYLGRQGVFTIMPYAGVEITASGLGNPFSAFLIDLKLQAQAHIVNILPEPQAGLLTGILLGNERGISPQLADDFSQVGASHVIAISGFNMVIVSVLIVRMLENAFGERKRITVIVGIGIIIIYTLFVGASATVVRAAFMSSMLIIANYFNRKTFVPASLALVALVLSIADPAVIQDIGFQLSFLAVLGLSLFADPLSTRFKTLLDNHLPSKVAHLLHTFLNEPLIVSIAAQIATLPLIVMYFGRLSLLSIPVNILIVPVQSLILIFGILAVMVSFISPILATVVFWVDMVFLSWTISIVRAFAQFNFADIAIQIDPRLIQACYVFFVGGTMVATTRPPLWLKIEAFIKHRVTLITIFSIGIASTILMLSMANSRADGQLHVWFLDMGHSNAVLVQSPNGAHMLVDGGRFPSRLLTAIGDRLPFYDRDIEILAITHPDEFDTGALNSVLDRYNVGVALWNGQANRTETFLEIQERLATSETVAVQAGYTLELDDGLIIEVLHPQKEPSIVDDISDNVMVLRLVYGDVSILLSSDLSTAGQSDMLAYGISPTASVLQLPRHATINSLDTNWIELAQPQIAILQSDKANRRGDPNEDTLLKLGGIPIFRTDEIGTIHIASDGQSVWVVGDASLRSVE